MLTYIQITAAKPKAKAYNLSDGQGLYLTITPAGSKLWRLNYRYLDKQKTLHLAAWPALGLADARARRDAAKKKQLAEGVDPAIERKRARIAAKFASANTFKAVAEEWLVKCERDGLAPVTGRHCRTRRHGYRSRAGAFSVARCDPALSANECAPGEARRRRCR